jgi:hypothetical protein
MNTSLPFSVRSLVKVLAVLAVVGLLTAACGNDDAATTPTTPTGPSTENFSGTLDVQGSSFYSFTTTASGQVSITLASLVATRPGPALNSVMGLAVGAPLGTDCNVTSSINAAPGLAAQLVTTLTPATYCARIYDVGNLTTSVNFTVRIVHP